jgi:putative membrane protein
MAATEMEMVAVGSTESKKQSSRFALSKIVTNSGSTARDHLANERTLLAWVRTSASMIALGIAIAKFSHSPDYTQRERVSGSVVGGSLTLIGIFFSVYSQQRYHKVALELEEGKFSINTHGVDLALGILIGMAVLMMIVVVLT